MPHTWSDLPFSHLFSPVRGLLWLFFLAGLPARGSSYNLLLPAGWTPRGRCTRSLRMSNLDPAPASAAKSVLFVCLGNICRSPTAEAVFKSVVEREGKSSHIHVDSCGTGGGNPGWYQKGGWSYHEGDMADSRMRAAASKRGIDITSRSRPLKAEDIESFDFLICMDGANKSAVMEAADYWGKTQTAAKKIRLMTEYCTINKGARTVPDPYYGGADGFEKVLDLLKDACDGLIASM